MKSARNEKKIFGVIGVDNIITLALTVCSVMLTVNSAYQQLKITQDQQTKQIDSLIATVAADHDKIVSIDEKLNDMKAEHAHQSEVSQATRAIVRGEAEH